MLFCQRAGDENLRMWQESTLPVGMYMRNHQASQGLLDPSEHCYRQVMIGDFKNTDVVV